MFHKTQNHEPQPERTPFVERQPTFVPSTNWPIASTSTIPINSPSARTVQGPPRFGSIEDQGNFLHYRGLKPIPFTTLLPSCAHQYLPNLEHKNEEKVAKAGAPRYLVDNISLYSELWSTPRHARERELERSTTPHIRFDRRVTPSSSQRCWKISTSTIYRREQCAPRMSSFLMEAVTDGPLCRYIGLALAISGTMAIGMSFFPSPEFTV